MRFNSVQSLISFIKTIEGVAGLHPLSSYDGIIKRVKSYPKYLSYYKVSIDATYDNQALTISVIDPDIFAKERLIDEISLYRKDA